MRTVPGRTRLRLLHGRLKPLYSRRASGSVPSGPLKIRRCSKRFERRLDKSEMFPVRLETVKVSLVDAYKIRRIYRRLAKIRGRGHLRRLTVFIRHENVLRLLEFLGYRQEE